jgi:hypothetical protein
MARRKHRPPPEGPSLARRGRLTVRQQADDSWVAELVDEGEIRTFAGSRDDVLVWGMVQLPREAVVVDPEGGERSFYDWVREVQAEVGPTRPKPEDVPDAVVAYMGCPGGPIGDAPGRP